MGWGSSAADNFNKIHNKPKGYHEGKIREHMTNVLSEKIDRADGKNDNKLDKSKVKKVLMAKKMGKTKSFYKDDKGRVGMN